MGISQFNRSNPMIILMRRVNDEFTTTSMNAAKSAMRRGFIQVLLQLVILAILITKSFVYPERFHQMNTWILIIAFFILFITILFNFNAVIYCGKNRKMKEINEMIYGETYQVADVNNEDVLRVINDLEFMLGRLDATMTLMLYWHGITIATQCLILVYLIRL